LRAKARGIQHRLLGALDWAATVRAPPPLHEEHTLGTKTGSQESK
jgi:hypothetical protein